MGQTLSEPVTTKESQEFTNESLIAASCAMQGWRANMEDRHCMVEKLPQDPTTSFFGLYDGHGGGAVAQAAMDGLHKSIGQTKSFANGKTEDAIREGFLSFDERISKDERICHKFAGTTAVVVLIRNNKIYCGNVGDSRAIARVGQKVVKLSNDHIPSETDEAKRVYAAGGTIEQDRVNGFLAMTRALGDFSLKGNHFLSQENQIVSAKPDVMVIDSPETDFILIASDGIWDVLSNDEAVDLVVQKLATGKRPKTICEELVTSCLAPHSKVDDLSFDNMTIILVCLTQGQSWEHYCAKFKHPEKKSPANVTHLDPTLD